ncbi:YbhB/YbcL family Raf kinase inhibitor-like protein [Glaciihabitans sp. UYNi722]|uniref:YbhB/YbcL family Raf kinase inhibitor-like protein n=1 Tax=Glaciihabitans sp. UYNi722 TaxID=3156344 RepID=UPI003399F6E5
MVNDPNWRLPEVPAFDLESLDFTPGGPLPTTARADGGNRSPALHWSGAPEGTKSFALTAYDPDAPTGSGFWHWAVYNIPGDVTELPAGVSTDDLPAGAVTLSNEMGGEEFTGAAPPPGDGQHRYFFTVSALDIGELDIPAGATPAVLGFMLRANIIGRAQLIGLAETPA